MVDETNILPITIRSDRGVETPMMANAHIQLHAALNPSISPTAVYWCGTSTLSQEIESWWGRMSRSQTLAWEVIYLMELRMVYLGQAINARTCECGCNGTSIVQIFGLK